MINPNHDHPVINRFGTNAHAALHFYFDLHYRSLFYFASKLTGDKHVAEDLIVESFLQLWKRREYFITDINVKAFLFITVRHNSLNYIRNKLRQDGYKEEYYYLLDESTGEDIEATIDGKQIAAELLKAIVKELPPKMLEIFFMFYYYRLTTEEIAGKMNLSRSTIRVQRARAIKMIRKIIARRKFEDDGIAGLPYF
jgi:RNA polymerase sigma-70 factor (ECF subfamily)